MHHNGRLGANGGYSFDCSGRALLALDYFTFDGGPLFGFPFDLISRRQKNAMNTVAVRATHCTTTIISAKSQRMEYVGHKPEMSGNKPTHMPHNSKTPNHSAALANRKATTKTAP
jgi:hypothetical protein